MAGCCPTSNGKRLHSPLWKLTSCTSILTFLHNHTFPFIFGYIYCDGMTENTSVLRSFNTCSKTNNRIIYSIVMGRD